MSYSPTTWKTGDVITSNKLNNIEGGIESVNESYLPTTWKTGDIITAEKLNHIEEGITESVIPKVEEKDVNFYDYNGTILHSYTAEEFAALDALPDNPSHEGLTAQGWNWPLADAKTYVASYGKLNVGQMYTTTSGATEIDIELQELRKSPYLGLGIDGTVTIDWGDGSAEDTVTGTSLATEIFTPHDYEHGGKYTIKIKPDIGTSIAFNGHSTCGSFLLWGGSSQEIDVSVNLYQCCIQSVRLGNGVASIGDGAFYFCYALESITIPSSVISIGDGVFNYCHALKSITIPLGVTSIGNGAFNFCYVLDSITIPSSVTSIGVSTFSSCYALKSITIPLGVTSIGNGAFTCCYTLDSVIIPLGVTSIGTSAFSACRSLKEIHILSETPPTLTNSNTFTDLQSDVIFYVPAGKLETYQTANVWSTLASQMQEEPS